MRHSPVLVEAEYKIYFANEIKHAVKYTTFLQFII